MIRLSATAMLVLGAAGVARSVFAAPRESRPEPPAVEPLRVEITGDPTCVDASGFFAAIRARTGRAREATPVEVAEKSVRLARVHLQRLGGGGGSGERGSLTLVDAAGHESAPRIVRADTCAEAVNALALVVALSIDPAASLTAATPAPDAGGALDPAKLPIDAPAGPEVVPAPSPPSPRPMVPPPTPVADVMHFSWSAGGGLGGVSDIGGIDPAPQLFVDLASSREALLSPSFRLSGRYVTGTTSTGADTVRFSWWMGELDTCPLAFARLRVRTCADVQLGEILASPSAAILNERGQPWVSAGVLARARVLNPGPGFVELDLGLDASITRQRFVVEPATAVYQAPVLVGRGGIDVGVRFP